MPAVQTSLFVGNGQTTLMRKVGRGHLSRDFQAFAVERPQIRGRTRSRARRNMCALVFLTLPVAIQRVGMAASTYRVDCGNFARRSCCDGNYAPTGHLWSGCLRR